MTGVLLPGGGTMYGEGTPGAVCGGWGGSGVVLPGVGTMRGGSPCSGLLAEAFWRVSSEYGDASNLGTAGTQLDAAYSYQNPYQEKVAAFCGPDALAATTPDAAVLDLTGDFVIALDVWPLWSPPIPCQFLAKPLDSDTDDCYAFGISAATGVPYIEFTRSGETVHEAWTFSTPQATVQIEPGTDGDTDRKQWVLEFDADNGEGGWAANLYEGVPGSSPVLLSSIVNTTDGAVTIETSSLALLVGDALYGSVYRARLYSGRLSSPTLVADFWPEDDWTSGTTMTSSTGAVWSNVYVPETAGFTAVQAPDATAFDIGASSDATYAFRFVTPYLADVDNEQYTYATRVEGNLFGGGTGWTMLDVKIDGFGLDGMGAGTAAGGAPVVAIDNTGWATGEHTVVLTFDRDTDLLTVYVDGAEHASGDISGIGAINPAADVVLTTGAHIGAAAWDRVLTADEIESLDL